MSSIGMAKPFAYIPVVDMGPVTGDQTDSGGREMVATQLRAAIEKGGTCYVINHGVPLPLVKALQRECLRYFHMTEEGKRMYDASLLPQETTTHGGVGLLREGFHAYDLGVPVTGRTDDTSARTRESLMYYAWPLAIRNEEVWPESFR